MAQGKPERNKKVYPLSGTDGANWDGKTERFEHMAPTKGVHDCDLPEDTAVNMKKPSKGY